MTPCQKIKREILLASIEDLKERASLSEKERKHAPIIMQPVTVESVDTQYDALIECNNCDDAVENLRTGGIETKLPCDYSRDYETKAVAMKMCDGSWVGWTYYYGGGKHGEPGAVRWMEDAYDLEVTETEKLVLVREFKKK